jgi:SAM-dependent methyltransferase
LDKIQKYYWLIYHQVNSVNIDIRPKTLIYCDISEENLNRSKKIIDDIVSKSNGLNLPENIFPLLINHDKWPFVNNSLDCIVNNLYMHNTDSVEILLKKYNNSLVADGCLISNFFTFNSFQELKIIMNLAEEEREGGVSPNVMNFPQITEVGNMLSKLGYNLPSMSITESRLYFEDLAQIFEFLKIIGETNFLTNRRLYKNRDTFIAAMAIYQNTFNSNRDKLDENTVELKQRLNKIKFTDNPDFVFLTLEICSLICWKYHEDQQRPKERGSAEIDLKDLAFETLEKNEDPTLRIGKIKPINDDEYEIVELTQKIKEKINSKLEKK